MEALRKVQPMGQSERSPLRGFTERGGAPCHVVDGWPIVCTCSWVVPDSWEIQARFHPFVNVCPSSRDAASVAPDGLGSQIGQVWEERIVGWQADSQKATCRFYQSCSDGKERWCR